MNNQTEDVAAEIFDIIKCYTKPLRDENGLLKKIDADLRTTITQRDQNIQHFGKLIAEKDTEIERLEQQLAEANPRIVKTDDDGDLCFRIRGFWMKEKRIVELTQPDEWDAESTEEDRLDSWPCQQLHGGIGAGIRDNVDSLCVHPECHPAQDDRTKPGEQK